MYRSIFRKVPSLFAGLFSVSLAYLEYSFVSAGIFGPLTLLIVGFSLTLSILALGLSTERGEAWFKSKIGLSQAYWPSVLFLFVIIVIIAYLGVLSGGADYASYMSG